MLYYFFIKRWIFLNMIEQKDVMSKLEFSERDMMMQKFYSDLDEAIRQRNRELIYKLSKIITRRLILE